MSAPPPALATAFAHWQAHSPTAAACISRVAAGGHGDLPRWLRALDALPEAAPGVASFGPTVTVGTAVELPPRRRQALREALLALRPWRKGPFEIFGVLVDAEWRSDQKWARVAPHLDLGGRRVLDVGCGNGYYGWRMLAAGAASVTGIDPSPLFALQHAAVAHYATNTGRQRTAHAHVVLPLRLEELQPEAPFDAVFSMGVVYHRRAPAEHIRALARHAHGDTVLVLESLVVDGPVIRPASAGKRYARMRNVHVVPNVAALVGWVEDAGFPRAEVADITTTTTDEQRATEWMPHQSLRDALDPENPAYTVEGYPAPRRAVIIARR